MGEGEPKRIGLRAGGFSEGKGHGWGWGLHGGQRHPTAQDGQEGGGGCAPLGTEPPQSVPAVTMVVPSGSHQPLEGDTGVKLSLSPGRARLLGGWAGGSCGLLAPQRGRAPHPTPAPCCAWETGQKFHIQAWRNPVEGHQARLHGGRQSPSGMPHPHGDFVPRLQLGSESPRTAQEGDGV